jgi:hypothetical protein
MRWRLEDNLRRLGCSPKLRHQTTSRRLVNVDVPTRGNAEERRVL